MGDRPLSRKLIRPVFRLLRGRRGAHFEETWPGLALSRPENGGAVLWRGREVARLRPLEEFLKGIGDRAAILGSGPSVAAQRLERLDEPTLMLNGALSLVGTLPSPAALVVEDERFVWRHLPMLRDKLPVDLPCLFSPAVLRVLAGQAPDLLDRPLYLIDDLRKPFDAPRQRLAEGIVTRGDAAFSDIPSRGVVKCGTVAYSALQMLMAGSRRISLAGVDLGNATLPRFYEKAGSSAWSGIEKGQARILSHFALAADLAPERGVQLECLSPVSRLTDLGFPLSPRLEGLVSP